MNNLLLGLGLSSPSKGVRVIGYLPGLSASPYAVFGVVQVLAAYSGPLFTLRRASDGATQDFAAAVGQFPSYSAIAVWASGAALTVQKWFDQTGNGKHLEELTAANQPSFDWTKLLAGVCPVVWDGERSATLKRLTATGLAVDRQNFTVFDVLAPRSSLNDNQHYEFTDGATTSYMLACTRAGNPGFVLGFGSPSFGAAKCTPRAMPSVIITTSKSTGRTMYVREDAETNATALTAQSMSALVLGRAIAGTTYNSRLDRWAFGIYPALSDADANTLRTALTRMFVIPTSFTSRLILIGDSITEGYGCAMNRNMPSYLTLPGTPEVFNMGVSGENAATENSNKVARYAPLATTAYGVSKCVFTLAAGINDLSQGRTDLVASQTALIAGLRSLGAYPIGLATLLPNGQAGFTGSMETARLDYNTGVRGSTYGQDFVIDVASDPIMGLNATTANTNYYGDQLHPTSLGYSILAANWYGPAINARLAA